ncbi:MAG: hypothetical protein ACTHOG_02570 [Marmoricola sp.]
MSAHRAPPRPPVRPLLAAALAALVTLALGSSSSLSDWAHANVTNSGNSGPVGAVAFTHTYASGPSCSAGAGASSVACSGTLASGNVPAAGLTKTDTITNNGDIGSSSLTQTVAAGSCAPVQFANSKNASNVMLPRYGTTFDTGDASGPMGGVGYATLDGATSQGGYGTSVAAQTQPGASLLSAGTLSGIGIWFKASSGTTGPLFSFGANADNTTGGNWDRTLYLNSSGQLTFVWNTGGSTIGPTSSGYANGSWHFAYLTLGGVSVALIGLIPQVTLYVDGTQAATTPLVSLSPFTTYSGYWHLGYAPTATTGLSTGYFKGSLSDFVVFDGSSFPTATSLPTSASTFATFATNATEWWPLNDTGTTTYTGTLPIGSGSASPAASAACKSIDLGWSFTSPAGTATSASTSLYTLVTTGATAVSVPGSGSSQTATLALSHDATYNGYVAGLHLYVPMSSTISTVPGNKWPLTFAWTPGATTTIVPAP